MSGLSTYLYASTGVYLLPVCTLSTAFASSYLCVCLCTQIPLYDPHVSHLSMNCRPYQQHIESIDIHICSYVVHAFVNAHHMYSHALILHAYMHAKTHTNLHRLAHKISRRLR